MTFALALLKRFWPFLIIAALGAALALSQHNLGNARTALANEAEFRTLMRFRLGGLRDDAPYLLFIADQRMAESADRKATLDRISKEALDAKQRSDANDAALARTQEENQKKLAAVQHQLDALKGHKSTGDREADWKIIEQDTQAPWKGWHK